MKTVHRMQCVLKQEGEVARGWKGERNRKTRRWKIGREYEKKKKNKYYIKIDVDRYRYLICDLMYYMRNLFALFIYVFEKGDYGEKRKGRIDRSGEAGEGERREGGRGGGMLIGGNGGSRNNGK